jgi:hypothetical protein
MNITKRTCANCANYEPMSPGEAPMCQNGGYVVLNRGTPQEERRGTRPDDTCDDHITPEEVAAQDMQRSLSRLTLECLKALQAYGHLVESLGEAHADTLAAWKHAEKLDPTGYLAGIMKEHQARRRDAQILAEASPEFIAAMSRMRHLGETLGIEHPQTGEALAQAMELAPETFRLEAHAMAVEMGLVPATPDAYTEDGQPLYRLDGIAARLGIPVEEAEEAAAAMVADRAARGLPTEVISTDAVIHTTH